jgi:hypothetical protein
MGPEVTAVSAAGAAIKLALDTMDRVSDIKYIMKSADSLLTRLESLIGFLREVRDTYVRTIHIIGGSASLSYELENHINNCYKTCSEINQVVVSVKISRCPAVRVLAKQNELEHLTTRLDSEKSDLSHFLQVIR